MKNITKNAWMLLVLGAVFTSSCKKDKDVKIPAGLYQTGYGNHLSAGRYGMAAAVLDNKAFFAGGSSFSYNGILQQVTYYNNVDIYNATTNQWSTATLSVARGAVAGAALGTKVMFAGGTLGAANSSRVDIYDISTAQWTTAELSQARQLVSAVALGNKIVFAGGFTSSGYSSRVDIYDITSGQWSIADLSEPRIYMGAAGAGNKILFGGGYNGGIYSNKVDVYDVSTGQWSVSSLTEPRAFLQATASGNKIVFAGGGSTNMSAKVDIYDVVTGQWTAKTLASPRQNFGATSAGNLVLLAGGVAEEYSPSVSNAVNSVELVDPDGTGGNATSFFLKEKVAFPSAVTVGNKILVAGGITEAFVNGERRALNHTVVNYFEIR